MAEPRLFNPAWRVEIQRDKLTVEEAKFFRLLPAGIAVTELRVQFEIEKSLKAQPNTCDLKITNLSPATRSELEREGVKIQLFAGYDGLPRPLFSGDCTWAYSSVEGTEWTTEIQVGDGTRAFAHARHNKFYGEGTPAITILRDAAKSMNLTLPPDVENDGDLRAQFASGHAFEGRTRDLLDRLLAPFGYSWSIQSGKLQILRDEDSSGAPRVVSEQTGMIGSPDQGRPTTKGKQAGKTKPVTIKMFLYPEMNPGGLVSVTSREVNGIYRIQRVKHTGDSHGDDWHTEIEVKPQ